MRWITGLVALALLAACSPGSDRTESVTPSTDAPTAVQTRTGAQMPATPTPEDAGETTGPAPETDDPPFGEETVDEMPAITAGTGPVPTTPPPRPDEARPTLAPMTTPPRSGRREVARMTIAEADGFTDVVYDMGQVEAGGVLRVETQCQSPQPFIRVSIQRGGELGIVEVPCHHEQGMRSSATVGRASDGAGPVFLELVPDPEALEPLAFGTLAWVRVLRD